MDIHRITLEIGLPDPMKILQITDTHFSLADEADSVKRRMLATRREREFGVPFAENLEIWRQLVRYGKETCDAMVHTGDLIDFVSHANLLMMKERLKDADFLFATGGHEFIQDLDELIALGSQGLNGETLPYKMESVEKVRMSAPNDWYFSSRIVKGVNLVAMDDSYYTLTRTQARLLKEEVAKGLPVVLFMHGPLHTRELYDTVMASCPKGVQGAAWLVGTPDDLRKCYTRQLYALQQPDESTFEFIEYVKREPAIKAIMTGHLHRFWMGYIAPGKPQIVTGLSCRGEATELTLL